MRTVNANAFLSESKKAILLRIRKGQRFEASEYNRIYKLINIHVMVRFSQVYLRYDMMTESFLAIASFATAEVRSIVSRTEFFSCCGRYGASNKT